MKGYKTIDGLINEMLIKAIEKGISFNQISKDTGLSFETVRDAFHKKGMVVNFAKIYEYITETK